MMREVLLLGGGRMIGPQLIEILLARGCHVTVVNRNTPPRLGKIDYISGDRSDANFVKHLEQIPFDYVLDLSSYEPESVSLSLAAFSGKVQAYFLMSTGLVYQPRGVFPLSENSLRGENLQGGDYARKKLEIELLAEGFADKTKIVLLRAPFIVGHPDFMNRLHFIAQRLLAGETIFVPGYGNAPFQLVSPLDTARAIDHITFDVSSSVGFNAYNIGAEQAVSAIGLVQSLASHLNVNTFEIQPIFLEEVGLSNDAFSWSDFIFPFPDQTFLLDDKKLLASGFKYELSLDKLLQQFAEKFLSSPELQSFSSFPAEDRAKKIVNQRKEEND